MGRVFMKGATPVGSASLCRSCSWAHIVTGYRESEMVVVCTDVSPNMAVPFQVRECTGYHDRNRPSWDQMEKLAVDVKVATTLKPVGFKVCGKIPRPDEKEVARLDD